MLFACSFWGRGVTISPFWRNLFGFALSHWELSVTQTSISSHLQIAFFFFLRSKRTLNLAKRQIQNCLLGFEVQRSQPWLHWREVPKFVLHFVGSALHPRVWEQADSRLFSAAARQLQYSCCFILCLRDAFFIMRPWPSGSSNSLLYGNFYRDSCIYLLCS